MNNLVKVENDKEITSLELVKQINIFREEEGKQKDLEHFNLLNIIRDEFDEEIGLLKIQESSYINSQNKKQPMFNLTYQQAKQVLMRESKFVRRATVKYIESLEKQLQNQFKVPTTFKEALLLAVKQQEQIEQLELENLKKDKEITYKEDVIIGLVDDIDLSTKRQRITQIINKGAKRGNYSDRWNILYREFEKKYHLNLRARIDKCQISPKVKNKIDYIERVLEMIPQLYELTCKIFENDVEKLKHEWFDNI